MAVFGLGFLVLSPYLALLAMSALALRFERGRAFWGGAVGALAVFAAISGGTYLTRYCVQNTTPAGLACLRRADSRDEMLRACYSFTQRGPALWGPSSEEPERAREVYYRVTGQFFGDAELPAALCSDEGPRPCADLQLQESELTQVRRGDAIHFDWTMTVANRGAMRDARALLVLPAGGVVSRVTCRVGETEREAVCVPAHHGPTQRQRGLLQVTSAGPGRVEVVVPQMRRNSSLQFCLGIEAPMQVLAPGRACVELPHVTEADFDVSSEASLAQGGCDFPKERLATVPAPRRVAVVVDGSAAMNRYLPEVREALRELVGSPLLIPTDEGVIHVLPSSCKGGQDNQEALRQACDVSDTVLWIHAPLPYRFAGMERLRRALQRRPGRILEVQLGDGPDEVLRELERVGVERLPRTGSLAQDLGRLKRQR